MIVNYVWVFWPPVDVVSFTKDISMNTGLIEECNNLFIYHLVNAYITGVQTENFDDVVAFYLLTDCHQVLRIINKY